MINRDHGFDLGRLYEKLQGLAHNKIFEEFAQFSKHYEIDDYLAKLNDEQRFDFLFNLRHSVSELHDEIFECMLIACADDDHNQKENDER